MNRKQDRSNFQPLSTNILKTETPSSLPHLPANCVTTRFVRTATNKQKCPVYQVLFLCRNVAGPKISFFIRNLKILGRVLEGCPVYNVCFFLSLWESLNCDFWKIIDQSVHFINKKYIFGMLSLNMTRRKNLKNNALDKNFLRAP